MQWGEWWSFFHLPFFNVGLVLVSHEGQLLAWQNCKNLIFFSRLFPPPKKLKGNLFLQILVEWQNHVISKGAVRNNSYWAVYRVNISLKKNFTAVWLIYNVLFYSQVSQLYIYLFSFSYSFPLWFIIGHWIQFPVLCSEWDLVYPSYVLLVC